MEDPARNTSGNVLHNYNETIESHNGSNEHETLGILIKSAAGYFAGEPHTNCHVGANLVNGDVSRHDKEGNTIIEPCELDKASAGKIHTVLR